MALLGASLILSFFVFKPYLFSILFALIIAVAVEPAYASIKRVVRNESLSAILTILLVVLLILIPLGFIATLLFQEAVSLYDFLTKPDSQIPALEFINQKFAAINSRFGIDLASDAQGAIRQSLNFVIQQTGSFFSSALGFVLDLFITVLALFYFLKEKARLSVIARKISPLADEHDELIARKMKVAVNSVVRGSLMVSLVQGMVASVGFTIFGIPNPIIWGAVAAIASFVPTLGSSIVTVPAVIYLFWTGSIPSAIGMAIWAMLAVGLVDNLLAPLLIERKLKIHPFLILLSILGGLSFFGALGFILGPLSLALTYALIEIYGLLQGKGQDSGTHEA